jgi:hypothetical protein
MKNPTRKSYTTIASPGLRDAELPIPLTLTIEVLKLTRHRNSNFFVKAEDDLLNGDGDPLRT